MYIRDNFDLSAALTGYVAPEYIRFPRQRARKLPLDVAIQAPSYEENEHIQAASTSYDLALAAYMAFTKDAIASYVFCHSGTYLLKSGEHRNVSFSYSGIAS